MHRHVLLGSTCSYKTSALPTHGRLGMCLLLYAARLNPPQLNRQRSKPYACGLKRPHGSRLRWQFCSWSITTQVLSGPNKERSRVLNLQSGRFGGTACMEEARAAKAMATHSFRVHYGRAMAWPTWPYYFGPSEDDGRADTDTVGTTSTSRSSGHYSTLFA